MAATYALGPQATHPRSVSLLVLTQYSSGHRNVRRALTRRPSSCPMTSIVFVESGRRCERTASHTLDTAHYPCLFPSYASTIACNLHHLNIYVVHSLQPRYYKLQRKTILPKLNPSLYIAVWRANTFSKAELLLSL